MSETALPSHSALAESETLPLPRRLRHYLEAFFGDRFLSSLRRRASIEHRKLDRPHADLARLAPRGPTSPSHFPKRARRRSNTHCTGDVEQPRARRRGICLFAAHAFHRPNPRIEVNGLKNVEAALKRGKGIITVLRPFRNWEVLAYAVATGRVGTLSRKAGQHIIKLMDKRRCIERCSFKRPRTTGSTAVPGRGTKRSGRSSPSGTPHGSPSRQR